MAEETGAILDSPKVKQPIIPQLRESDTEISNPSLGLSLKRLKGLHMANMLTFP